MTEAEIQDYVGMVNKSLEDNKNIPAMEKAMAKVLVTVVGGFFINHARQTEALEKLAAEVRNYNLHH